MSSAPRRDSGSSPKGGFRRRRSGMPIPNGSWLQMLPDFDDLHGVGAPRLADRLADGEDDDIAFLDDLVLHQDLLRLLQELLPVVADVLDDEREDVAEERAAVA